MPRLTKVTPKLWSSDLPWLHMTVDWFHNSLPLYSDKHCFWRKKVSGGIAVWASVHWIRLLFPIIGNAFSSQYWYFLYSFYVTILLKFSIKHLPLIYWKQIIMFTEILTYFFQFYTEKPFCFWQHTWWKTGHLLCFPQWLKKAYL